jgi:hypothetical protein
MKYFAAGQFVVVFFKGSAQDIIRWGLLTSRYFFIEYKNSKTHLAELLERLTVNTVVAIVLGSIPASSDTVESEGLQMKQY